VHTSIGYEDSSAVKAEDAKFEKTGIHHRPSRRCRTQGNLRTQGRRSRKVREPRKLGDPSADAKGESSRGTGDSNPRPSRRMRLMGKPIASSVGAAGRAEFEGN
jgi:hypothetical protein